MLPLAVAALISVRLVAWLMTRSLLAPVTLADSTLKLVLVPLSWLSAVQSSPVPVIAPVPRIEPFGTVSVTFEATALIAPALVRLPLATVMAMLPVAVTLFATKPLASVTVSPPAEMLDVSVFALVKIAEPLVADTLTTFAVMTPLALPKTDPLLTFSVTLEPPVEPASTVPANVRFAGELAAFNTFSVMLPLAVVALSTVRSPVRLRTSELPAPVTFARSDE